MKREPVPQIYGPGDWMKKTMQQLAIVDANSVERNRLTRCIHELSLHEPLSKTDSDWLAQVLMDMLNGIDVRRRFKHIRKGRKFEPDDHKFFIAYDALVIRETQGLKGKALRGELAKKWGYDDCQIKNFIDLYQEKAALIRRNAAVGKEAEHDRRWIETLMPRCVNQFKKAKQSK